MKLEIQRKETKAKWEKNNEIEKEIRTTKY